MEGNNIFNREGLSEVNESFITLYSNENIIIEKIVSFGQTTSVNKWLEQDKDEWVVLLQGKAEIFFEKDNNKVILKKGYYILIPSHSRHRVEYTSSDPPCIWLAVHFRNK